MLLFYNMQYGVKISVKFDPYVIAVRNLKIIIKTLSITGILLVNNEL